MDGRLSPIKKPAISAGFLPSTGDVSGGAFSGPAGGD